MFESSESMTMCADILCPVVCVSDNYLNKAVARRERKRRKEHLTDSRTDWQSRGKALNLYLSLITTESSAVRMCRICESLQWRRIMSMPSSAHSFKYETDVNSTLLSITVAIMRLRSTYYCPSQFMSYKHEIEVNTLLSITVYELQAWDWGQHITIHHRVHTGSGRQNSLTFQGLLRATSFFWRT